jgi:hypothetical protein
MAVQYNPGIVTDGLVLCLDAANLKSYPGTGTGWRDVSLQNNITSLVNGPTYSSVNGGVLNFDGTNDYVTLPRGIFGVGNNAFAVSVWFKTTSGGVLLSNAANNPTDINGDAVAGMYVDSNGKLVTACFYDGAGNIAGTSTQSVNNGLWHNAVVTVSPAYTGAVNHFSYLNGVLFDSRVRGQSSIVSTGGYFLCGGRFFGFLYPNWPASNYLNCQIGNVSIYRKTLSSFEIQQNFNALRGRFGI